MEPIQSGHLSLRWRTEMDKRQSLEDWVTEGHLTWEQLAKCCLSFMSESDIENMMSKMFVDVTEGE